MINKRTKIICTMGPREDDPLVMEQLIKNGMDVARFNFSHGSYAEMAARIAVFKAARRKVGKPVAMLLDTKGPEIRTGRLAEGKDVKLEKGASFTLTNKEIVGTSSKVYVTYPTLAKELKSGDVILIDDGEISVRVQKTDGDDVIGIVENGGMLGEQKGVNIPNVRVGLPDVTDKDIQDINFGIDQGFDLIAASFVRSASAIRKIREVLKEQKSDMLIFAKIENTEGVANIDSIIEAADGIMVARGDLGVEINVWEVPPIQKMIIDKCNQAFKPVITATQMLDSMIRNPRPTRAEVTDVANAIYDGTDALMLSGETAIGAYAVEAVDMMAEIARNSEKYYDEERFIENRKVVEKNISCAVGLAAVQTAKSLHASCIITPSSSGDTARMISNFRPQIPIYAVTPNVWAEHRMMLYWGVTPLPGAVRNDSGQIIASAIATVKEAGFIKKGDLVVITAGDPVTNLVVGSGHMTNMMYVVEVK